MDKLQFLNALNYLTIELNDLDYQHPQQMVEEQRKVAPHQLIQKWKPRKKVGPKDLVSLSIKNE